MSCNSQDPIVATASTTVLHCELCNREIKGEPFAFDMVLHLKEIEDKDTFGYQCRSCDKFICFECLEKTFNQKNWKEAPCPKCGKSFGPGVVLVKSTMGDRVWKLLEKRQHAFDRGRIPVPFDWKSLYLGFIPMFLALEQPEIFNPPFATVFIIIGALSILLAFASLFWHSPKVLLFRALTTSVIALSMLKLMQELEHIALLGMGFMGWASYRQMREYLCLKARIKSWRKQAQRKSLPGWTNDMAQKQSAGDKTRNVTKEEFADTPLLTYENLLTEKKAQGNHRADDRLREMNSPPNETKYGEHESVSLNGDSYRVSCLEHKFKEELESRSWNSDPLFSKVLDPLNSRNYAKACAEAEILVQRFNDFASLYYWWGKALLATQSFEKARKVLSEGLSKAKEKYLLCSLLGEVAWKSRSLKEAVYWWAQGLHCQESLRERNYGGDVGAYLYLHYVAKGIGLSDYASAFIMRVDQIQLGGIRLSPETSDDLCGLAGTAKNTEVESVLKELVSSYIFPQRRSSVKADPGEVAKLIQQMEEIASRSRDIDRERDTKAANRLGELADLRAIEVLTRVARNCILLDVKWAAEAAIEKIKEANR
jgi:hypothetical protein